MNKELELWRFIAERLGRGEDLLLLVVAKSSGSSPGRVGYKMAVAANGDLCGSIGGGVMEVNLVDRSRDILTGPQASLPASARLINQVHQKHSPDASGMICSGRQTVIFKLLDAENAAVVQAIMAGLKANHRQLLRITSEDFQLVRTDPSAPNFRLEKRSETDFIYEEKLGSTADLHIVGGGHCALALSEFMSRLDFRVSIYDDRPDLNTVAKNKFADNISIVDTYENISEHFPDQGEDTYVVVMTLGYASDKIVIKQLCDRDFKYFGVLGSKAKMATLMKELKNEGVPSERLERIRTPVGLPINSRTPEEIAVSIAAEIIAVKNASI